MITYRLLARDELPAIWTIDRSEIIERIYVLREGELVLEEINAVVRGWPPGERELHEPELEESFEAGSWFLGAWDGNTLAGVAVLDNRPLDSQDGALQLSFLHVSNPHRGSGAGRELFERARREAHYRGARTMYISATESEHTVNFYLARGCRLNPSPDPQLFALEPKDIHLRVDTSPAQRLP